MNTDASNVEDINIHQIKERLSLSFIASFEDWSNIFRTRSFTLCKNDRDFSERFDPVAVSESISSSSMTNMSVCWVNGCPPTGLFLLPTFHQISTLEKTTFRQCSILSSLMSWRPSQVSPFLVAAHSTSPEVRSDFQIWFSPGFPMQSRQVRSDPLHGIARPNSSSASILLWLFLHLHLLVFFSTSLQNVLHSWSSWCWTNTKDDSIHHVWNFPLSVCLRVGFWCQCSWFGSWVPSWFYQTINQEQLCGFWKHVSLSGLFPFWSSRSLLHYLQRFTTKLPYEKNSRLRK